VVDDTSEHPSALAGVALSPNTMFMQERCVLPRSSTYNTLDEVIVVVSNTMFMQERCVLPRMRSLLLSDTFCLSLTLSHAHSILNHPPIYPLQSVPHLPRLAPSFPCPFRAHSSFISTPRPRVLFTCTHSSYSTPYLSLSNAHFRF
jgi:hypothetical protein